MVDASSAVGLSTNRVGKFASSTSTVCWFKPVNRMTGAMPSISGPLLCCNCTQPFGDGARNPVDAAAAALVFVAPDDADCGADCSSGCVDWSGMSSRN